MIGETLYFLYARIIDIKLKYLSQKTEYKYLFINEFQTKKV